MPLRHLFPLNIVPLIEVLLYTASSTYTDNKALCPNADTWKDKSQPQRQGEG
jgi:hypothetical protein